jgi:endonuclease-8
MPEGPEIRRAADRLAKAVVGRPLAAAWFAFPALKHHEAQLVGRRIEAIEPHGKALLTRFSGGLTLYSHNQLYGIWKVAPAGARPPTTRSLRVALDTARRSILLYSASDVSIWPTDAIDEHPFLRKLGPDILDEALQPDQVAKRLLDARFRRRQLAALLLDQGFLAGMGNYLRSEVLFAAGLAPGLRPLDLDAAQVATLADALLDVPRLSYRSRGVRRARGLRADHIEHSAEGFRFHVFGRAGEPCTVCAATVLRRELSGRRLYLCPQCQPESSCVVKH